ncbi:MAG: twin-arginine translocase TatA/TatE family subunit [Bdellovibrionia bacterium]
MFGISGEHLLILGIVLLIFGPRRLPELGNTLGKAIRNFKDAVSGVEEAQFRRIEEQKAQQAHQAAAAQTAAAQASTAQPVEAATTTSSSSSSSGNNT